MNNQFKKYFTGYLANDLNRHPHAKYLYKGRGWHLSFEITDKTKSIENSKELTIHAKSLERAENAFALLKSAIILRENNIFLNELEILEPEDPEEKKFIQDQYNLIHPIQFNHCQSLSGAPIVCKIATEASQRNEFQYGLMKFRLATLWYSLPSVELDPRNNSYQHLGETPFTWHHVLYAYSIIISYSVIEELGLEVRASSEKKSLIKGIWNPEVKSDLENRLKEANVNLKKGVFWHIRGESTKLQQKRPVRVISKPSFAKGPHIRDAMVDVCDAINQASYLRSTVASHKMNELVKSLTPIDSENVRGLAQFLILTKLGFWNSSIKDIAS